MEDMRALNNEELAKVVGGTGLDSAVEEAFSEAKRLFNHYSMLCQDEHPLRNMADVCDRVLNGSLTPRDAGDMLQEYINKVTDFDTEAQRVLNSLKAVV